MTLHLFCLPAQSALMALKLIKVGSKVIVRYGLTVNKPDGQDAGSYCLLPLLEVLMCLVLIPLAVSTEGPCKSRLVFDC